MSGRPDGLDLIEDPDWLEEPLCGLPEEASAKSLMAMVPGVSLWVNSSAATTGGKVGDVVISGAGAFLLGKGLGAILHVPLVGGLTDWVANKILKKTTGIDFSLKGSLNFATRSAAMALESSATGRRQGAAVLKAQALMGELKDVGSKITR
jgi:hypothetical protein